VPSFTLYRGSLLALLVGAALALWLIVQPSSGEGGSALRPVVATSTSAASGSLTTPAGSPGAAGTQPATTPGTPRPGTTAAPGATATRPPATGTAGAGTTGVYVVVSGDSLSLICSDKIRRPGAMTVTECVAEVRSLNGLTGDNLEVGQNLRVPQ
jgi:hypothetical protein